MKMKNEKLGEVQCGVRGHLGPACNAVRYVDRQVWGINHLYQYPDWRRSKYCTESSPGEGPLRKDAPAWCWGPFESEGMLSSVSAILTSIIGVHYGHVLIHFKDHAQRLKHWVNMGLGFLILGVILHYMDAIPLNKQLYSFSYVCLTGGTAGLVFSAFHLLIDIWDLRRPLLLFQWMHMNDLLVFAMAALRIFPAFVNGWYYDTPNNTLVYWIQKHIFFQLCNSRRVGKLMYVLFGEILFWGIIAGICHRFDIYWKL